MPLKHPFSFFFFLHLKGIECCLTAPGHPFQRAPPSCYIQGVTHLIPHVAFLFSEARLLCVFLAEPSAIKNEL